MTEAEAMEAAVDQVSAGLAEAWALRRRATALREMGMTDDLDGNTPADLLLGAAAYLKPLVDLVATIEDCVKQAKEQHHG